MIFEIPNKVLVEFLLKAQADVEQDIYDDGFTLDEFTEEDMVEMITEKLDEGKFVFKVEGE